MAKNEAPPIYCYRHGDRLIGEFEADRDAIRQLPSGQRIKVTMHTGRYPPRLKFYWAFLGKVVAATGCAPHSEALHALVKLETGHTTPIKVKGYTVLVPASVAFDAMTEADFEVYLEGALEFIAKTFGITPEDAFGRAA